MPPTLRDYQTDIVGRGRARMAAGRRGIVQGETGSGKTVVMAYLTGVAILLVAHLNKGTGDAVDRISGSAAYRDAVRAAYLVCPDPEDDEVRLLMPIKRNLPNFETTSVPFRYFKVADFEADNFLSLPAFADLSPEDSDLMRGQLGQLRFEAPQRVDANDVVGRRSGEKVSSPSCKDWLIERLGTEYAWPDAEIEADALKAKFSVPQYRRAKRAAGVASRQNTFGGQWLIAFGNPKTMPLRPAAPSNNYDPTTKKSDSAHPATTEETDHFDQTAHTEQTENRQSKQSDQSIQSDQCVQSDQSMGMVRGLLEAGSLDALRA